MMMLIFFPKSPSSCSAEGVCAVKINEDCIVKKVLGCRVLTPSTPAAGKQKCAAHEAASYKKGEDYMVS